MKLFVKCLRCGRTLKTYESKVNGFGPTCFKKANENLRQIEILSDTDLSNYKSGEEMKDASKQ